MFTPYARYYIITYHTVLFGGQSYIFQPVKWCLLRKKGVFLLLSDLYCWKRNVRGLSLFLLSTKSLNLRTKVLYLPSSASVNVSVLYTSTFSPAMYRNRAHFTLSGFCVFSYATRYNSNLWNHVLNFSSTLPGQIICVGGCNMPMLVLHLWLEVIYWRRRMIFRVHSSLFTELYKIRVYLLKSRGGREWTLISISGETSLKSATQGE